jgi:hypothetical protein
MSDKPSFLDKIAYAFAAVFILRLAVPLDNLASLVLALVGLCALQMYEGDKKDKPKNAG